MADSKLSALTALTGANVDTAADLLLIDDVSVTTDKKITVAELGIATLRANNAAPIQSSLGADVDCTNISVYFDGPSISQGTVGTWFVSGTVTVNDPNDSANFEVKLWDGATVIASSNVLLNGNGAGGNPYSSVSLSGFIVNPTSDLRISCKDITSTSGKIISNFTGLSKDSHITAFRIA